MVQNISSIPPPTEFISSAVRASNIGSDTAGQTSPGGATAAQAQAGPGAQASSDLRLVIEHAAHAPVYVYKVVDAITGDVLVELPREQVARAAENPNYTSGSVIDTRA